MKRLYSILLVILGFFIIVSCGDDNSFAITQPQLLSAHKWQLKEERTIQDNTTTTDGLLACERQSTLDFTDPEKYYSAAYATTDGNCVETDTNGTYNYQLTGTNKRYITLTQSDGTEKTYYMYQLDPSYLILQETVQEATDTESQKLKLYVYIPIE
ncbi:lipocalin family protein [Chishuiella sp.]|uniref:lipocalin family protein n=1 Tax=Chishuiella sp. TaxID=1969467 RepID=UPI0028A92F6E|nr:lipocalin family protein [Chishuiella sp.]